MQTTARRTLAVLLVAAMIGVGASAGAPTAAATGPQDRAPAPMTRAQLEQLVDSIHRPDGSLAMPQPRVARSVSIHRRDRGGATIRFRVAYGVSNRKRTETARADRATVELRVAHRLEVTGPNPAQPIFVRALTDKELTRKRTLRSYRIDLSPRVVRFLREQGWWSSRAARAKAARRLITVQVRQYRDFQRTGAYSWIQTATFDGTHRPVRTADDPGGSVTVVNATGTGVYGFTTPPVIGNETGGTYQPGGTWQQVAADSPAIPVAVSGAAISCLYQGTDQSNPEGLNGTLDPNAVVTATIVADDKATDNPPSAETQADTADAVQVAMKSAITVLGVATSVAFSGAFTMGLSLALSFLPLSLACNNQPNIMQINVASENGLGASSYNWAIWDGCSGQCGGLANIYSSPWQSAGIDTWTMVTNGVQLAPDTENGGYYLAQQWVDGCGVGDASDANTSGCTSENTVWIQWTQPNPCPWVGGLDVNGGIQGGAGWCQQPPVTSPEIQYCGENNANCPSYPG